MLDKVASGQEGTHRTRDLEILKEGAVDIQTQASVQKVTEASVEYLDKDGKPCKADADLIIISTGQRPAGGDLAATLEEQGFAVRRAQTIGNIRSNTRSGFLIGYDA
jgi:pyruvate/2-oxoglutarate dehydrogenase complex dihydrolipoamide dehydrogenase (E3) component